MGHSHRLHCEKAPAEVVLPRSWGSSTYHRSCWNSSTLPSLNPSSATSITVWFSSATKSELRRLRRVVRTAERIVGTTLPTLQELYLSRVSKRAGKITLDPSHPAHSLLNCCRLVDATELLAPERPDTGTVFPPSNPSHEHLTLTWNTQHYFTTILQLFIHHTYIYSIFYLIFFPFQICTSDPYTHDCLYCIVFLLFCTLPICIFVYCSFVVCVLSRCCHSVALWSFVTITNSSYV